MSASRKKYIDLRKDRGAMKTEEQINKIQNVVLYVLQHFENGVDYIRLYKILYFAQCEYLANYGKLLFPETFRARKLGPVPTLTMKVIKSMEGDDETPSFGLEQFEASLSVQNKIVSASSSPDMEYLSKKEIEILDKWIDYCRDKGSYELSEQTHDEVYKSVIQRVISNPELDVYTSLDLAKSGKASAKMLEYIKDKTIFNSLVQ